MDEKQTTHMDERIHFLARQFVIVNDFDASGWILDVGGGGEGVIGQLKGEQVVAIDPVRKELVGAARGPLKIVMDARNMLFLNGTFTVATAFFTMMYVNAGDHEKIFEEVYRVLVSNGRFLFWDAILPPRLDEMKEIVAFNLQVKLPDREINTGYGANWPERQLGISYYQEIAESVGFTQSRLKESGQVFYLEFHKSLDGEG